MAKFNNPMLKYNEDSSHRDENIFSVKSVTFPWRSVSLVLLSLMEQLMLYISEEDKNEKGATADSVQQRRQYRRQNRQSSSGYKRFYPRSVLSHTQSSLFNQVSVHVILHSWFHGLLKLCSNPNLGVFSSSHTVMAALKTVVDFRSVWFQIQGLPLQKMRGPRGQQQGQVQEMVKSGGDVVAPRPHGGDTGMSLQGKTQTFADTYLRIFI